MKEKKNNSNSSSFFATFVIIGFIMAFLNLAGSFLEGILTFIAWSAFIIGVLLYIVERKRY